MKLRIAVLASNYIKLPPLPEDVPQGSSGAPEKIMSVIAEGLVRRGHDVTLFASGDSKTSARLVSVTKRATALDPMMGKDNHVIEFEHLLISECYSLAKEGKFDIVHSIFDTRSAYYAQFFSTPTVSTLHSPLDNYLIQKILPYFANTQYYVSISDAQRKPLPKLSYAKTIYHGIDISSMQFNQHNKDDYMVFAGRITLEKGVDDAINVAEILKKKLHLLGSVNETKLFWIKQIKPHVDNDSISYHGYVSGEKRNHFFQNARLFMFPIKWEEPFGLVMIEAMASGTPVVAYSRGSVPEVIKDGETGFIVNSSDDDIRGDFLIKKTGVDGLSEAVERIYSMSEQNYLKMRKASRVHVENNFTIDKMIDNYEKLYSKIIEEAKHEKV